MKVLLTICDIGVGAAVVGWLWPAGVAEAPLYALSVEMIMRAVGAVVLAMFVFGVVAAIWSGAEVTAVGSRR